MLRGSLVRCALELRERHLALLVADEDLVDRRLADDPGDALLLLREEALHAVRHALGDQDDAGPADDAVHGVELRGAGDGLGDRHWPRMLSSAQPAAPGWPSACA